MNANPNANSETGPRDPWTVWCERPDAPDEVCRALANGSTLLRWSATHDFDHYSVWHWLRTSPACAEQYKGLADFRMDRLLDEMLELADDSSQDLLTDDKGKVKVNRAHFTRIRIQLDTRKTVLRQMTTARRLAKDEKPQWSYEEELLKLGLDDEPYDPQGLLKGYKKPSTPAYDPGPPPISAATRQLGAAPGILSPPNPNPNLNAPPILAATSHVVGMAATPSLSAGLSSASAVSISEQGGPSSETLGSPRTFPSYRAYLRAIWESGWVEGTPLPFVYRPTPDASLHNLNLTPNLPPAPGAPDPTVGMASTPSPSAGSASASEASMSETLDAPLTKLPAQAGSTKQIPKAMIGGIIPKVDWYGLTGVRTLGAFLALFFLFLATAAANLHASIHSLSVPIKERVHGELSIPIREIGEIRVCLLSWFIPFPASSFRLPTSSGIRNPSQTFRHSRDAPPVIHDP